MTAKVFWNRESIRAGLLPGKKYLVSATAALIVGVGFRLWFYCLNDSFWRDETMLLLNVAEKSFWGLTGQLEYAQGAPLPVLWFYRSLYLLGLGSELPMRALSLGASILGLFLFYRLARLAENDVKGILFSIWLLALSPGAILFAAQAKPYALDFLIACGFLYLAAPWFIDSEVSRKNTPLFWYGGLAPWFSFPAIFIAGGVAGGLLLNSPRRGIRPALILILVVFLSFSLEYLTLLRHNISSKNYVLFLDFWSSGVSLLYIITSFLAYFPFLPYSGEYPLLFRALWVMGVLLIIVGMRAAGRKYGWAWVTVLILPLLIALLASAFKQYPIYGRCYLFAIPGLYLLIGYAVGLLYEIVLFPKLLTSCFILVVFLCFISSLLTMGRPMAGVREGLRFIITNQQSEDIVVCDTFAIPTVTYYRLIGLHNASDLNCNVENLKRFAYGRRESHLIGYEEILPLIPRAKRIWCIAEVEGYTRDKDRQALPYWQELISYLNRERRLRASYISDRVEVKGFSRSNLEGCHRPEENLLNRSRGLPHKRCSLIPTRSAGG